MLETDNSLEPPHYEGATHGQAGRNGKMNFLKFFDFTKSFFSRGAPLRSEASLGRIFFAPYPPGLGFRVSKCETGANDEQTNRPLSTPGSWLRHPHLTIHQC
jgi:hypothetical protein